MQPTIILAEPSEDGRQFPILIGPYEAEMLDYAVHKYPHERPLTHDLILNVIREMGGELRRIIVDKMSVDKEKGWYHGKLDVELKDRTRTLIDSRPSDAIILAIKTAAPIFVDDEVLRRALHGEPEQEAEEEE